MSPGSSSGEGWAPGGLDNLLVAGDFRGTWTELPDLTLPPVAAVLVHDHLRAAAAVRAQAVTPQELLLVSEGRVDPALAADLRGDGFALVRPESVEDPAAARTATPGRVWLLTSGTTGRPKRVAHSLESLTTVSADQPRRRWLCPYTPGTYAWWQVVTLSLAHPGQDVVFVEPSRLDDWPAVALAEGVTAASGTPTFWRQSLWRSGDTVAQLGLEQVTLGGEPVDQAVLDQLRSVFPHARISWIYASSEAGASIAVHDGRAGFPVAWLDRDAPGRPRLSVDGGELLIASPYRGAGVDDVLRTGDRVDVVDDRVLITGRIGSDEINVGGAKASAGEVRGVLLAHPQVAWARVTGRKAPLVGNVVTAELVLHEPVDEVELTRWSAERLPDYAVPRRFRVLDEIPIKETLKSDV